ncbi:hsp90 co-chaperone Cdc37 [Coemansia erecta]|uniref:Hsp90 chaperone protein kinase-targeting subunit n=1 Tax=Coemansia erecta TaxID=147472 RepID=A0A9W7XUT3_9FUNG|nr:hsp90 co-chaperone Cdc37 [Coemansia erecta]
MPIDYSKWDNLELSDDSDVEIHPNIEKGTFLRLRQRKIREDRENRRLKREGNEEIIALNKDLVERITSLRTQVSAADEPALARLMGEWQKDALRGAEYLARRDKAVADGKAPPTPSKEDMVDALKARINAELREAAANVEDLEDRRKAIVALMDQHLGKLEKSKKDAERELEEVKKEEAKHIDPDSIIHEGFSHSFVSSNADKGNSSGSSSSKPATVTKKETVTTDEVLNPGSVGKHRDTAAPPQEKQEGLDDNGDLEFDEDSKKFASLTNLSDSYDFIRKNFSVVSERKSDQIMGQAFTAELAGKKQLARQYIHQALIITYILKMGSTGVNVFFSRVGSKGQAQEMFFKDVESYYERIESRCKVIKSESEQEGDEHEVESIQLQCDDPNAPIRISVPGDSEEDAERRQLFEQLPEEFRDALREGTLEAINKVLATTPGPEAERLLGICGEGNFLVIDGEVLVDPNEKNDDADSLD